MKTLKKPIKPLNYESSYKNVYLYESECFLSCWNWGGGSSGYWYQPTQPVFPCAGAIQMTNNSTPTNSQNCGSQCQALTGSNILNCGSDSCYNNTGTIGSGCDISFGTTPGGCYGALCVNKVQTEGYSCGADTSVPIPGVILPLKLQQKVKQPFG